MKLPSKIMAKMFLLTALLAVQTVSAKSLRVVAAENFYGDIARQIGGNQVNVTSVLNDPNQDPHMFEASPSVARELARADVVIFNGISYDPWMEKLLAASTSPDRTAINVAKLTHSEAGANPHIWYRQATMVSLASQLARDFSQRIPDKRALFTANLHHFMQSMQPLKAEIAQLRSRYKGIPVTATEPVFNYMARALGLNIRNLSYQEAVMNDTDPAASDVAAMENDLKQHKVAVLIYNRQVADPMVMRLKSLAERHHVQVVGVTETQPAEYRHYQDWMMGQLRDLAHALKESAE